MAQPIFDEPSFAEGIPTPDPTRFKVPHPSDQQVYRQIQSLLEEDAVPFPVSRGAPEDLYSLGAAWGPHGPEVLQGIQQAGQLVFHAVGDTGASAQGGYPNELHVADQVTLDCHTAPAPDRPAFLYLLGDLIYDFGEAQYYYDQFYEPYRDYPAPIFAIPGNHDSFVLPNTPPNALPLDTFMRNFCATAPAVTAEAGSLHRTAMCEPGVYFALDAPFVRIIGLFSNALEDPGLISSENGKWKGVPDVQLAFLSAQLRAIKQTSFSGAVVLATHHPAFSYAPPSTATGAGGAHGSSPAMLAQIDAICQSAGVYPHLFLAGHAHNYQRYTRNVRMGSGSYTVPFIVCGGGGHGLNALTKAHLGSPSAEPTAGSDVSYLDRHPALPTGGLKLERYDDQHYGYLKITVNALQLRADYYDIRGSPTPALTDSTVIDLGTHSIVAAAGSGPRPPESKGPTAASGKTRRKPPR